MKRYLTFFLFLVLSPLALAQENSLQDPGVTPDSFMWGIDTALEQISLLLAANPEAKAVKGLEIAQERLLEIKVMAEEKNLPALEKAQSAHSKILLKVKENIKSLEEENPEELLETELELEKELQEHQEEISELQTKLKIKIKIEGTLTSEQQAALDNFLASLDKSAEEVKVEIKIKKDETKIKIKTKTGKSDEEIEEEVEKLEKEKGLGGERVKVSAETVDGKSFVKVELKFDASTADKEALLAEMVEKFSLDMDTAALLLKVEEEEEAEETEERLRVKVKIEEGGSEVTVKLRFTVDSTEESALVAAIVDKTQLTQEQIEAVWDVKEEKPEEGEEQEIEIEVEIEDGEAEVKIESDKSKMKFVLQETDREKIVQEIASRLGISAEEVLKLVTFEEEVDDDDKGEIEYEDKGSKKNLVGDAVKENSKDSENEDGDSDDSGSSGGSGGSAGSGSSGNSGSGGGSSGSGGSSSGSGGGNGGNGGDD